MWTENFLPSNSTVLLTASGNIKFLILRTPLKHCVGGGIKFNHLRDGKILGEEAVLRQDTRWMAAVLYRLRKRLGKATWGRLDDPFEVLVATILSQNTSDVNSHSAFKELKKAMRLTPEVLAKKPLRKIRRAIRVAGLADIKAKRLQEASKVILRELGGDFSKVFNAPPEEVRNFLLSLPGVGEKTADVLLVFGGGIPVVPVDTHLFTIGKRLRLSASSRYQDVRTAYERLIPPRKRAEAHVLFIELGKKYCTARNPKHEICPLLDLCLTGLESV